jgi:hypothetical protein
MTTDFAQKWYTTFINTVQSHDSAQALRDAAGAGELKRWTEALTRVVISTFSGMGWRGAAKGHRSDFLPIPRQEYLALDAVAFDPAGDRYQWRPGFDPPGGEA